MRQALKRVLIVGLFGSVLLSAIPAQSALAAESSKAATVETTVITSSVDPSNSETVPVTPQGGTGGNNCGKIYKNGKKTNPNDWIPYGHSVANSVRVKAGITTQWCVPQSFNPSCLLAVTGAALSVLTIGGAVVELTVLSAGVSILGVFTSC